MALPKKQAARLLTLSPFASAYARPLKGEAAHVSPQRHTGSFVKKSLRTAASVTLILGASDVLAPYSAEAQDALICGPQYSTVDAIRAGIAQAAPEMINLTVDETDRYLDLLGQGRPENSWGKTAVIVVVPDRGALVGMTDGTNMCSPYLRVTAQSHEAAIGAVMGIAI